MWLNLRTWLWKLEGVSCTGTLISPGGPSSLLIVWKLYSSSWPLCQLPKFPIHLQFVKDFAWFFFCKSEPLYFCPRHIVSNRITFHVGVCLLLDTFDINKILMLDFVYCVWFATFFAILYKPYSNLRERKFFPRLLACSMGVHRIALHICMS